MAQCEVCGNDYDKAFQVIVAGATHTFDSFERRAGGLKDTLAMRLHGVDGGLSFD